MSNEQFFFTSESVTEGHPDKICDQISDAVLDAIMAQDKGCRVACETLVKTGMALLAGEITTTANIDYEQVVRSTIKEIGYQGTEMGFDWETCSVLSAIEQRRFGAWGRCRCPLSAPGGGNWLRGIRHGRCGPPEKDGTCPTHWPGKSGAKKTGSNLAGYRATWDGWVGCAA